jgi:hypothetical protein
MNKLEIREFLTRQKADLAERRQVLFRTLKIANNKIDLANILVRAAMPRIRRQRAARGV